MAMHDDLYTLVSVSALRIIIIIIIILCKLSSSVALRDSYLFCLLIKTHRSMSRKSRVPPVRGSQYNQ